MPTQLRHLWNQRHIRHLIINLVVGGAAGTVAIYVVATLLINFLDIDFLRAPYGSPDGSAILPELYIDAADTPVAGGSSRGQGTRCRSSCWRSRWPQFSACSSVWRG